MSVINKKVSHLPISISDAAIAIGSNSRDLGTLCKSDKVNKFAKYKPVKYSKDEKEAIIEQCDSETKPNYDANLWKGDFRETNDSTIENGLIIPTCFQTTYTGESDVSIVSRTDGGNSFTYRYRTPGPTIDGVPTIWNNVFNKPWSESVYERDKPNVYRLADFANYEGESGSLFDVDFPSGVTLNESQSYFMIRGKVHNRDNEGLLPSDFNNIKNICLKIGNYEVRNQFGASDTVAFPIPKLVYNGQTSLSPILYMRGVDNNNYAKYMSAKFNADSVVKKTFPITILSNQYKLEFEFGFIDGGMYCTTASPLHNVDFYRSGDWIDKEQMGREWKSIRLYNFYWKAWLRVPDGSSGELPANNITFRCIMQDENYDDINCIAPPMILGHYTTNFNGNTNDVSNYQGYFFKSSTATSNDETGIIRFVDQENQDIAPMIDNYYCPLLTENPNGVERYTKEQDIAVRCRIRMQVVIDGVVFGTTDVPVNGDGHSLGYIWNNTPIPSTAQTQITDMHGGYYIEVQTGTTSTAATLYGDETTAYVYTNMPAANVASHCLNSFGTTNYMGNVFFADEDKNAFDNVIKSDTSEQENTYINWQFNS